MKTACREGNLCYAIFAMCTNSAISVMVQFAMCAHCAIFAMFASGALSVIAASGALFAMCKNGAIFAV